MENIGSAALSNKFGNAKRINRMRLKTFPLTALLLSAVTLTSCVTVYEQEPTQKKETYSAVISHADAFTPQKGQSFSWFTNHVVTSDSDAEVKVPEHIKQLITETIEAQLVAEGYRVATSTEAADFLIGAAVLLNNDTQSEEMQNFIQVFPAIRETLDDEQRGTLLLAAGRPETLNQYNLIWRGTVNASVTLSSVPESERKIMVQDLVNTLIGQFP